MTIYDTREASVHDAAPIECYKFTGAFVTYRYTSADEEVTVAGEVYTPAVVTRKAIRAGTHEDENLALELELPHDLDVVKDYAYTQSPPSLVLEVYRVHRGTDFGADYTLLWKGRVASFSVTGWMASIKVPSTFAELLAGQLPNYYYQAVCNHVLFDANCGANRGSHSHLGTVTLVGDTSFDLDDDGAADGVLKAGEAIVTRTGEARLILDNIANTISVNFPFVDLRVGDEVQVTSGCDHSYTTCAAKFANARNFGGHPYIPINNPFKSSLT